MPSVFAECISRKNLGYALNYKGFSEQLISNTDGSDLMPFRMVQIHEGLILIQLGHLLSLGWR
jgi:hypothetical protein